MVRSVKTRYEIPCLAFYLLDTTLNLEIRSSYGSSSLIYKVKNFLISFYQINRVLKLESPLLIRDIFPCQVQYEKQEFFLLQVALELKKRFCDMNDISSQLLLIIAKKCSTHSEYSILQVYFNSKIHLKNGFASCHADKGGYQSTTLPRG